MSVVGKLAPENKRHGGGLEALVGNDDHGHRGIEALPGGLRPVHLSLGQGEKRSEVVGVKAEHEIGFPWAGESHRGRALERAVPFDPKVQDVHDGRCEGPKPKGQREQDPHSSFSSGGWRRKAGRS